MAAGAATISNIQPYALLYIAGGDVRRLPLVANGAAPLTQLAKANTINVSKFLVDGNDYANPTSSRYIVSTAGADGVCGTADDGQAEVTLDTAGGVHVAPQVGYSAYGPVIGMLRDQTTQAPAYWVMGGDIYSWKNSTAYVLRLTGQPVLNNAVVETAHSIVAAHNNQITVVDFSNPTAPSETKLDPVVTAGTGWKSIGFDSNNYYVYINSGAGSSATWNIIKISRSLPKATQIATGIGQIELAAMGSNLLYATVATTSGYSLWTFDKTLSTHVPTVYDRHVHREAGAYVQQRCASIVDNQRHQYGTELYHPDDRRIR